MNAVRRVSDICGVFVGAFLVSIICMHVCSLFNVCFRNMTTGVVADLALDGLPQRLKFILDTDSFEHCVF